MPTITVKLESPVRRSFRVEQVAGMFDVPLGGMVGDHATTRGEAVRHELVAEVPGLEEKWTIGAIVRPSGSGKTTLAKAAFGKAMFRRRAWPKDRAIIDCFEHASVKELTCVLAAAGLGSPPTWLKPYGVLSTGEKFRADLLREVMTRRALMVVDEFTGALDRTVARTTSAAFGRLLRWLAESPAPLRLVAVTCHRDILSWLSPDWVVDLGEVRSTKDEGRTGRLTWGRPGKPSFRFGVERVPQAMWPRFSEQHYLSGGLAASATCYAAMWNQEPIGFCAVVAALGWKATKRIQRLVVLPEFQGLGVGGQLLDEVARIEADKGNCVSITASHPAVLAHCSKSGRWRLFAVKKDGSTPQVYQGREVPSSVGRVVAAFEYLE